MSDESPRPKKGGTVLKDTFLKWPFAKDFVYDVTTDGKVDNVKCIPRDANFQDAEIVRSKERRGLGPRERPSAVVEQRHFGGPGELCHSISDVINKIYRKYFKK